MGQRLVTDWAPRPRPEWTIRPYADRAACWGCGLPADVTVPSFPEDRRYCRYCDDLRILLQGIEPPPPGWCGIVPSHADPSIVRGVAR